ncbi:MAG: hypothetical protein KAR38_17370 [Calditrichia bacterium]|nr:hypothetical protein [Calditrichia bacterium]
MMKYGADRLCRFKRTDGKTGIMMNDEGIRMNGHGESVNSESRKKASRIRYQESEIGKIWEKY